MHNQQPLSSGEQQLINRCSHLTIIAGDTLYPQAEADFQLLQVDNPLCCASIALQGAQVLSFTPTDGPDLLWMSPNAMLETGKAIRGGIPICLPWFGVNQRQPEKPKHGFARTSRWQLEEASAEEHGATTLVLALRQFNLVPHPLFEYPFEAKLILRLGNSLALELQVRNCARQTMPLSWALHSYHPVADLDNTRISGLENTEYLDNTRQLSRHPQAGPVCFNGELDRVYLDVPRSQTIQGRPAIEVSGENAPSAVVWNPGEQLAAAMADLGPGAHRQYVCLERGAAFDDEQQLGAGESLRARVQISPCGH